MKKQVVVLGLGRFGISVASTLHSMGNDVLALDSDEKTILSVAPQLTRAIQADTTDEAVLKELGVPDYDVAIVSIGSIEASVLSTILLKKLSVRHIIARANSELHGSILEKIGVDSVVYPEREMGIQTAHSVTIREATDYMPVSQTFGISKLPALPFLVGRTLFEAGFGLKGRWEVGVLMLQHKNEVTVAPELKQTIKEGDVLIVSGEDDKIERLLEDARSRYRHNHNKNVPAESSGDIPSGPETGS
jgi:trk system potassium uptake protein